MQAGRRTRRNWAIALAASFLIHLLMLGFVRFAPVPATDVADEATPVAILRITKRAGYAHGRSGSSPAAPRVSPPVPRRAAPAAQVARGALAPRSSRASTTADARPDASATRAHAPRSTATAHGTAGTASAPVVNAGAAPAGVARAASVDESPGPAPTMSAEMLAALNQRMRDAIPSAPPAATKLYPTDMRGLAVRPDPNRWTVANYPLPQKGLFAHAIIVRVGREAVAVRAIQRIGHVYICIGYLAKVDEHDPQATLAGPYIGPCKKAWREQLGLVPKPSPSPTVGQSE
ncbi:MAG TPA: hypothetical protein VGC72_02835 [Candidatus Elarobacter sp.]|jgi:hypothetical protein